MTPAELQKMTEAELCKKASKHLTPKPWKHAWIRADGIRCTRCLQPQRFPQQEDCSVPPPATGSMAEMVVQLKEKVTNFTVMLRAHNKMVGGGFSASAFYAWWYDASPRKQVECCLLALEGE